MECVFCKKTFSSKSNLSAHQNTAKFCLEIQGKNKDEKQFKCEYCNKILTQRSSLEDHFNICKEKLKKCHIEKDKEYSITIKKLDLELTKMKKNEDKAKKIIEDKDFIIKEKEISLDVLKEKLQEKESSHEKSIQDKNEYIAKLEAKLEKFENAVTNMAAVKTLAKTVVGSQPVTNNTTNNITVTTTNNNVLNLSQEHVKSVLTEHLDYNVVYAGQAGLATFVVDKILKNQAGTLIYRCVDPSRQMFEFENENGETVRDMKAEKLIQSLVKGEVIKIGLEQAGKGWNTDDNELNTKRTEVFSTKVNEYANLNRNNTVFRSKVSSLTT
jgi:hypothetical protein